MSPPEMRNGGPVTTRTAATSTEHAPAKRTVPAQDATAVRVDATFLPPAGLIVALPGGAA